jgi:hypothetical protein
MSSASGEKLTGKRALSNTTLNMRFMQRKTLRESAVSAGAKLQQSAPMMSSSHLDRIKKTGEYPVVTASSSDMFVDIIGRRSFNGFNGAVETNFSKALHAKRDEDRQRISKDYISDEELLRRYELYIRGKTDSMIRPTKAG